ncbi:hypothetical protein GCM10009737_35000 [Nocardioides lentus]|uniref:WD40 repeat domain-containing protein n=1 Tax=Nocardioides lentus TaxID=338077 RepID=A0ABN2PS98_9ACTN
MPFRTPLVVPGLLAPLLLVACTAGEDTCEDDAARGAGPTVRPVSSVSSVAPAVAVDPDATVWADAAALSPDGDRLLVACDGGPCLWDTDTGRRLDASDLGGVAGDPVWAGDTLVSSSGPTYDARGRVVFGDTEGGGSCTVLAHEVDFATDGRGGSVRFAVAADEETMVSTAQDDRIGRWSVADRARTDWLDVGVEDPGALALAPDGTLLAVGTPDGVVVHDLDADARVASLDGPLAELAWSPDGTALAGLDDRGTPTVVDTTTWRPTATLPPSARFEAGRLAWSPDSAHLALVGATVAGDAAGDGAGDGRVLSWTPGTGAHVELTEHAEVPSSVIWGPDGTGVYSVDSVAGARRTPVVDGRPTGVPRRYPTPAPITG